MKNIIWFILLIMTVFGCKRNDEELFSDQPGIYFSGEPAIDFTFAKYKGDQAVVYVPIEISGYKEPYDREVRIKVVEDSTTAIAGLHYKALPERIVMPADSFQVHIPIEIYNSDPALKTGKVRLYLAIQPNDAFIAGVFYKQEFSLGISDILLKPKIWEEVYSGFFGLYSQTKHRKILELCDITEIPDVYDGGPFNYKWDAFGRAVNNYYRDNYPQYDENNKVIEPWM